MSNYALIFAGGKGTRMTMADRPKQFLEIENKAVICHTIDYFENCEQIDGIVVVTNVDWLDYTKNLLKDYNKVFSVIAGGATALDSQYLGLLEIEKVAKSDKNVVLIHDGVRPLITNQLIKDCIKSVNERGNAITTAPAIETIIRIDDNGNIVETLYRQSCQLARAPQCFYLEDILSLHRKSIQENVHNFIDSATMMTYYGRKLYSVIGPSDNIKVTTATDYYICQTMLSKKKGK